MSAAGKAAEQAKRAAGPEGKAAEQAKRAAGPEEKAAEQAKRAAGPEGKAAEQAKRAAGPEEKAADPAAPLSLQFREMVPDDAEAVAAIERETFPTPWSRESFWREAANENTCYRLALAGDAVIGFAGAWLSFGDAQVTNIAIREAYRGKGVGTALMADLIEACKARGCTAMTLEVRPSNAPALALYHRYGFREAGRRKGYYQDNHEDALIMWNTKL